jgi:3-methyladenine DNA glycosylase AlkD
MAGSPGKEAPLNVADIMQELRGRRDEAVTKVNARWGDHHTVKLGEFRALAKRIKTNHELAHDLWRTGDADARLLALLVCKPKAFTANELDTMIRDIHFPKLLDWFEGYVVSASPHAETLRLRWKDATDALVGRAGWSLTTTRVVKRPDGLDLSALLDQIETEMKSAPAQKQWAMNHCLAEIGIHNPSLRARAIDIGERLEVLKDYPASPGCTPPFAPMWIAEMVRRQETATARGC